MKLSMHYLKSITGWDFKIDEITEGFKLLGIEVEYISKRDSVKGAVFGRIADLKAGTDKLKLAKIEIAEGKNIEIVTNSQILKVGDICPVAPIGAIINGTMVEPRKVRNLDSEGVLLSAIDFSIEPEILPLNEREGIWIMPMDTPLFTDPTVSMWLTDTILDLFVTPNHPEWLSLRGLLREIAVAIWWSTGKILEIPDLIVKPYISSNETASRFKLAIENPKDCGRYIGILADVDIRPSGFEMRRKLLASSQRPINNVVDASNLAMYEDGQPTHAFDADLLKSGTVKVGRCQMPMKFKTIDDEERDVPSGTLFIWDGNKPIAIAGIMGGNDTEVSEKTKTIFLESAFFDPLLIAKSSSQLGLKSEASSRFEKGSDWEMPEKTALKVLSLIGVAGAKPIEFFEGLSRRIVEVRFERMKKILGFEPSKEKINTGLKLLGIYVTTEESVLKATIPGFRDNDLVKEIDLIEESARVVGYDKIPTTFPIIQEKIIMETPIFMLERRIRRLLSGLGLAECVTKAVTCESEMSMIGLGNLVAKAPKILNPMTSDATLMRSALEVGILSVVSFNIRQRNLNLALFEIGSQFGPDSRRVAVVLTGNKLNTWDSKNQIYDFFDMKGLIEDLLSELCVEGMHNKPSTHSNLHPYRQSDILIGGTVIGYFGQLHPDYQKNLDITTVVIVANFDIEMMLKNVPVKITARPTPKFPEVLRDIAVLTPNDTPCAVIERIIRNNSGDHLKFLQLFDVYTGFEGMRSLAFSLSFANTLGTLKGEEIDQIIKKIDEALGSIGASLRMA